MNGIGAISSSTAIRVIRPVAQAGNDGDFHRDRSSGARQAHATAGTQSAGDRNTRIGQNDAAFLTQMIVNGSQISTTPAQGAVAYLITQYRLSDLPIGFLVARAA